MGRLAFIFALSLLGSAAWAQAVQVTNVRTWPAPDHTRVVFDLDGPVEHTVFVLKNPERVVVDLNHARLASKIRRPSRSDLLLGRIRSAPRDGGALRVVLDMKDHVRPRSFLLKPNKQYGHRLVVDLYPKEKLDGTTVRVVKRANPADADTPREIVIAIDAGHGGDDPGAIAAGGVREKDVVLQIALQLERQLKRDPGFRPVLVRKDDYYVSLRRRTELARGSRADLFVSLHADSFHDPRVHGSSIYVISRRGASSEAARWLAAQENAADLVGGVSLDDKDELLASVLLDLSQNAALSASIEAGSRVLTELGRLAKTHKPRVERAGFMVLKSPDIPSILVETGFLTNPEDERRLTDPAQQRLLAKAVVAGIRAYFETNPPPGTLLAARRHVIGRGDTLSEIASRYQVSLIDLRAENELDHDSIRVGDVLRIPGG